MTRRSITYGFVLLATLAFCGAATSAAMAGKFVTGSGASGNVVTEQVEGKHVLSIEGNKMECATVEATSTGEVSSEASSYTLHPVFEGCSAFGFLEATVVTTGCDYVFSAPGSEEAEMKFAGTLEIACSGSNEITITAGTCKAGIGSQTISSGVTHTNTTVAPMDYMSNLSFSTRVKKWLDGFLCPFNGTGEVTGTYTGETTDVWFDSNGNQLDATVVN